MTAELAVLERRNGGGMVLPSITAQLRWSHALLDATATDEVRRQLVVAVSLLHQRASCAAFDAGRLDTARLHVLRALELARDAGEADLQACMFYTAGRMELYHGPPDTALRLFQFGSPAALVSGQPRLRALLEINVARAYATMGAAREAKSAMAAAIASFHEDGVHPEWMAFFDEAELFGAAGLVWVGLGDEQLAITALRKSVAARHPNTVLYRAFGSAELAACHLRNGDLDTGLRLGGAVIDGLHSRLTPLRVAADGGGRTTRSLYERVAELQRG